MNTLANSESFAAFISSRCVAYVLSIDELGQLQSGYRNHGCNCYSAGEPLNIECILPSAWPHMLAWLDKVYKNPEYVEQVMLPATDLVDGGSRSMEGMNMSGDDDQVISEDAEERIAAGEKCEADDLQVGGSDRRGEECCVSRDGGLESRCQAYSP